jgi:hypothetical protein
MKINESIKKKDIHPLFFFKKLFFFSCLRLFCKQHAAPLQLSHVTTTNEHKVLDVSS